MDEANKKFLKYITYAPLRGVKNWILGAKENIKKPLKPNDLVLFSIAIFAVASYSRQKSFILAALVILVLAWMHKEWIKGDFRNRPPI